MTAYYNEIDPYAAQWLRNLIAAGHIAPGDVDERSIVDVRPDDLKRYTQCHFFAGIGGWSYALRLAGWPDDRPVWTGSCPCQDFSNAAPKTGQLGQRHLWPNWFGLIRQCKPSVIFGEQVASAIAQGWLDDAFYDLEKEENACAAAVLPALSVGAPHDRPRIWFVAKSERVGSSKPWVGEISCAPSCDWKADRSKYASEDARCWFIGNDGFKRTVEPCIHLLANGLPPTMGALRGFGNAIVPQVAAEFIKAVM